MLVQTHCFFPDLTIEIDAIAANPLRPSSTGAIAAPYQNGEMFGGEASGQSVEVTGITPYRIEDDTVQSERGVVDNFGLMMQLGVEPGLANEG